jgi:hypothetical protein
MFALLAGIQVKRLLIDAGTKLQKQLKPAVLKDKKIN